MDCYAYQTLDVFTDRPFGGNPLAVFTDARGLDTAEMQALAAEINYSETTFVLPPDDPSHDARVRIFHRTGEMPFAGHPNVGTAFILAAGMEMPKSKLLFEEIAGLVEARLLTSDGKLTGAEIDAPQALTVHGELDVGGVAACLGIGAGDIVTTAHAPTRAGVGVDFVLSELSPSALASASPNRAAFERLADSHPGPDAGRLSLFVYCRDGGSSVRARMFAPLAGTWEDPATGSANAALAALLLSLDESQEQLAYEVMQGVEMGRPSRLLLRAWRDGDQVRSSVAGNCSPIFRGEYRRTAAGLVHGAAAHDADSSAGREA